MKKNQKEKSKVNKEQVAKLADAIVHHLRSNIAHSVDTASNRDWWLATCMAVREIILNNYTVWQAKHYKQNTRRVYYFSLEYLMGRQLENALVNLGLYKSAEKALANLGQDLVKICSYGPDLGLGNGGLGRLAACFLDSLSTLQLPALAYGIHYEFGLFRQEFENGRQVEHPEEWVKFGNPWEIIRPEYAVEIQLYGHVYREFDNRGHGKVTWSGDKKILGVPIDIPIPGYGGKAVNLLRLWEARASSEFNYTVFNEGGYSEAVREKVESETISKVLYPNDMTESGKELRLVQQYFFVACSLRDIIRRHFDSNNSWATFPDKVCIQLNDTHPSIAIIELMRILVDEEDMEWESAWEICKACFAYTNHTLLPEALETWSVPLLGRVLPRHLQIIFEINKNFLENTVRKRWPGDMERIKNLSLIEESSPKKIRMTSLSVISSFSVNGVAEMHTKLLKESLFKNFYDLYPDKFNNKTNGVTPRRWILSCNKGLSDFISEKVGDDWPIKLNKLANLEKFKNDDSALERLMQIKKNNKIRLAEIIKDKCEVEVSPDAIFDVQIKRLHEYKRQHLNLLHILTLYRRLLNGEEQDMHPHVFIFGAKAAPGYILAKDIIYAINCIAKKINFDLRIKDKIKVVFLPNYSITLAEQIIPAADISEQISTAGKEASGTGNMKLALNGALTIGTLDGANVEIREEVGDDNIFIFGHTIEQIEKLRVEGYNPYNYYNEDRELRNVIDWLHSNYFSQNAHDFHLVVNSLLKGGDPFFVLADYRPYLEAQKKMEETYKNKKKWARMSLLNIARMAKFSSDRTIEQYAKEIWNLKPVPAN